MTANDYPVCLNPVYTDSQIQKVKEDSVTANIFYTDEDGVERETDRVVDFEYKEIGNGKVDVWVNSPKEFVEDIVIVIEGYLRMKINELVWL